MKCSDAVQMDPRLKWEMRVNLRAAHSAECVCDGGSLKTAPERIVKFKNMNLGLNCEAQSRSRSLYADVKTVKNWLRTSEQDGSICVTERFGSSHPDFNNRHESRGTLTSELLYSLWSKFVVESGTFYNRITRSNTNKGLQSTSNAGCSWGHK